MAPFMLATTTWRTSEAWLMAALICPTLSLSKSHNGFASALALASITCWRLATVCDSKLRAETIEKATNKGAAKTTVAPIMMITKRVCRELIMNGWTVHLI